MTALLVVACALAGLGAASVVNRAAVRIPVKVPDDRVPVMAAATCTSCGERRPGAARAPLAGLRRAACSSCGEAVPRHEAWVEVACAAAFAVMAWRMGAEWELIPFCFFSAVGVAVAVIDLAHYRIPDRLVFPSLAASVPMIVVVSMLEDAPDAIPRAAIGAVVYTLPLFLFHLVSPRGMGFGDVKLGLLIGMYAGWVSVPLAVYALLLGGLLGTVMGVAFALASNGDRAFPFGPALVAGGYLAIVLAPQLLG